MDLRKLKASVAAMRDLGVSSFEVTPEGGVKVTFADASAFVQGGKAPKDDDVGDLDLPPGVLDPREAIRQINKRRKAAS